DRRRFVSFSDYVAAVGPGRDCARPLLPRAHSLFDLSPGPARDSQDTGSRRLRRGRTAADGPHGSRPEHSPGDFLRCLWTLDHLASASPGNYPHRAAWVLRAVGDRDLALG